MISKEHYIVLWKVISTLEKRKTKTDHAKRDWDDQGGREADCSFHQDAH